MVTADSFMLKATTMKASGSRVRFKAKYSSSPYLRAGSRSTTAGTMKGSGMLTNCMGSAMSIGQQGRPTMGSIATARRTERAFFAGPMGMSTKASLRTIKWMVLENFDGRRRSTLGNGRRARCTERETLLGMMGGATVASTVKTRSRATESFIGQTGSTTKDNGKMASSTVRGSTKALRCWKNGWGSGMKGNESSGSIDCFL